MSLLSGTSPLHLRLRFLSSFVSAASRAHRSKALWLTFTTLCSFLTAHASVCTPSFPLQSGKPLGWQGADAAYSIPLPGGRDVWIFGDTLYGPTRVVQGDTPRMVHNSLGISTCDASGHWHLEYVIRHDAAGRAVSFFSPTNPNHWYWAMDGFVANGDLWVTLLCVRHPTKPAPAAMDFETCGSDLAQITHLARDPQNWQITIHPLVPDGAQAYPSATAVVRHGYAYLFALREAGTRPLLLTRIPLDRLKAPAENLQYLAADDHWKPGFDPTHAKQIMEHGSPELSVRYHPDLKKWIAIMVEPVGFSDKILLRTAPDLTGPWSEGRVIYRMPEMQPGPGRDKNVFCYAGKEHPEFETGADLVFTYVCNTFNMPDLVRNLHIYHPQVVREPNIESHTDNAQPDHAR